MIVQFLKMELWWLLVKIAALIFGEIPQKENDEIKNHFILVIPKFVLFKNKF